jgi:hypothetical protein
MMKALNTSLGHYDYLLSWEDLNFVILSGVNGQIIADVSKDICMVQEGLLGMMGPEDEGKKYLRNVGLFLPVDTVNTPEDYSVQQTAVINSNLASGKCGWN